MKESVSDCTHYQWLANMEYYDEYGTNIEYENQLLWQEFMRNVLGYPDGLFIDANNRIAFFIEVEDTNPMSEEKLSCYSDGFYWLDEVYWQLALIATNRYGGSMNVVNLIAWHACRTSISL